MACAAKIIADFPPRQACAGIPKISGSPKPKIKPYIPSL